jgi:hypothetical protein
MLAGGAEHRDTKRSLQLKTHLESGTPSQSSMNRFLVALLHGRDHLGGQATECGGALDQLRHRRPKNRRREQELNDESYWIPSSRHGIR